MRSLMRFTRPDVAFRTTVGRPWVALYRPGPMAANMHNDYRGYRRPKETAAKPVTCLHDDLAELPRRHPGAHDLPEGLMRVAQRFAGYNAPRRPTTSGRRGPKKKRDLMALEREKVRRRVRDDWLRSPDRGAPLRHHRAVRRLRLPEGPRLLLRDDRLPDGLAEGEPPRWSTSPPS